MTARNFNNTSTVGTLSAPLASSATSATTTAFTGTPAPPFTVTIDRNTATEEVCLVTANASGTLTLTRGYDGTAGQAHAAGATVEHTAGAIEYAEANAHNNSTSGAHGTTGSVVGNQGTQTIYDKTLVSPVAQADVTKGDAVVAVIPSGATSRNLLRGVGADGANKIVVDSSGNLTAAGVALTTLNGTVATHTSQIATANTNIATANTNIATNTTNITTNTNSITSLTTTVGTKAATTYVDSQDTATLNSAKAYTDGKFSDGGWQAITFNAPFTAGGNGAFYRVLNGICYFSLDVTRTTSWAVNSIVFTFPAGARPGKTWYVHTLSQSAGAVSSTVATSGTLSVPAGVANDDLFITGSYPVN